MLEDRHAERGEAGEETTEENVRNVFTNTRVDLVAGTNGRIQFA